MALQAGVQAQISVPILDEDRANNSQPSLGYEDHPLHAAQANKAGGGRVNANDVTLLRFIGW